MREGILVLPLLLGGCVIATEARPSGEFSGLRAIESPGGRTSYSIQSGGQLVVETTREVRVPRLGIRSRNVDPSEARAAGLSQPGAVRIESVDPEGPAARTGLLAGDLLTNLDGVDILSQTQLTSLLQGLDPGKPIPILGVRRGTPFGVNASLDTRVETRRESRRRTLDHEREVRAFGLEISTVPADLASTLFDRAEPVAILSDVLLGGPAYRAGLRQGDVLLAIDGTEASSGAALLDRLRGAKAGEKVRFRVAHGRERFESEVKARPGFTRRKWLYIPLVLDWTRARDRFRFELVEGILLRTGRQDLPSKTRRARAERTFGLLLDLFEVTSSAEETRVTLLWFISFRTSSG